VFSFSNPILIIIIITIIIIIILIIIILLSSNSYLQVTPIITIHNYTTMLMIKIPFTTGA